MWHVLMWPAPAFYLLDDRHPFRVQVIGGLACVWSTISESLRSEKLCTSALSAGAKELACESSRCFRAHLLMHEGASWDCKNWPAKTTRWLPWYLRQGWRLLGPAGPLQQRRHGSRWQ